MALDTWFDNIRGRSYQDIISNPEALRSLLQLASVLLLNGGNPSLCESCIRDYYQKILANFETLKTNYMDNKRTNIPAWKGIKYVKGAFFNSDTITDLQAINALKNGYLSEFDFDKLPEGYNEQEQATIEKTTEEEIETQTKKPVRKKIK